MIVSLFTGGAHCCTIHFIFELAPQFKLLATLNDSNDDLAHFERLADGHYYYITADWTFGYWPTCFACSPSALVTLRWTDDAKGGDSFGDGQDADTRADDCGMEQGAERGAEGSCGGRCGFHWNDDVADGVEPDLRRTIGSGVEVCGCAGAEGAAKSTADPRGFLFVAEDESVLARFAADVEGCAAGVCECGGKTDAVGKERAHFSGPKGRMVDAPDSGA